MPLQVLNPKEFHALTYAQVLQQLNWFPFTDAFNGHMMKERHFNKGKRKGLDAVVDFEKCPEERSWELSESQHVSSQFSVNGEKRGEGERRRSLLLLKQQLVLLVTVLVICIHNEQGLGSHLSSPSSL